MYSQLRLGALLLIFVISSAHPAHSQSCPDPLPSGPEGGKCRKQLMIINNTDMTIYAAIQSNTPPDDGDDWLVAALGGEKANYKPKTYYRAYINPDTGIPPHGFASIIIPWWSKQTTTPSGSNTP